MKLYPSKYNINIINYLYNQIKWVGVDEEDNLEKDWYNFLEKHNWYNSDYSDEDLNDWNKWFDKLETKYKKELYIILINIIEKRKKNKL